jgi:hypothetical protein
MVAMPSPSEEYEAKKPRAIKVKKSDYINIARFYLDIDFVSIPVNKSEVSKLTELKGE